VLADSSSWEKHFKDEQSNKIDRKPSGKISWQRMCCHDIFLSLVPWFKFGRACHAWQLQDFKLPGVFDFLFIFQKRNLNELSKLFMT